MTRLRLAALAAALGCFLGAGPAVAHQPFCACEKAGETIRCKGGFSEGEGAEGVKLDVIGYDETVLISSRFGKDSVAEFKSPAGEFYVLFDAGPGLVVEIDHKDIR